MVCALLAEERRLAKVPGSARESHLNEIVNLKHLVCQEYIEFIHLYRCVWSQFKTANFDDDFFLGGGGMGGIFRSSALLLTRI